MQRHGDGAPSYSDGMVMYEQDGQGQAQERLFAPPCDKFVPYVKTPPGPYRVWWQPWWDTGRMGR